MKLFHGTTYNRLMEIAKDGLIGLGHHVWNVSMPQTTYFWTQEYLNSEYEGMDEDDIYRQGIVMALESAECALSQEESNLKRVVLIFDSSDIERYGLIEPDSSCENMNYCAQLKGTIPIGEIKEIYLDRKNLDKYSLYFKGIAVEREDNEYNTDGIIIDNYDEELSREERECSKMVHEKLGEWWIENMHDTDSLEKVTNPFDFFYAINKCEVG